MRSLAGTSLSDVERRTVERAVRLLEEELGSDLHAVWLYGSRARGERPAPDSDVDLLVVAARDSIGDFFRVGGLIDAAAEAEGADRASFSAHLYTPERVEQRRRIRSFFIQEVDRDKIVLFGEP